MREKNYISTLDMPTEEWLQHRKRSIGASESPAVLGISKYKSPRMVWKDKLGGEAEFSQAALERMEWGNRLEAPVADKAADELGVKIYQDNKIRYHRQHQFISCNLDRRIRCESETGPGLLEVKTTTSYSVKTWDGEIDPSYFCQVQHQFAVTGWSWGYLAIFIMDTREFRLVRVERDDEFITLLERELCHFWNTYVVQKIEPPISAIDLPSIESEPEKVVKTSKENIQEILTQIVEIEKDVKLKKKQLDQKKKQLDQLKTNIQLEMGPAELLVDIEGKKLATWKAFVTTRFDSARFKKEHPDIHKAFSRKSQSRRFKVTLSPCMN